MKSGELQFLTSTRRRRGTQLFVFVRHRCRRRLAPSIARWHLFFIMGRLIFCGVLTVFVTLIVTSQDLVAAHPPPCGTRELRRLMATL